MATVAGVVVHCVTGLARWEAVVVRTGHRMRGLSWQDIVDFSKLYLAGQKANYKEPV